MFFDENEYKVPFFIENSFYRKKCEVCGIYFWTLNKEKKHCGEAPCEPYSFLKRQIFKKRLPLKEMRKTFLEFFAENGHEILEPYPVAARWRDDIYLTIASIALFQPHVTDGKVPPPANPLVISQPCIRLVDIDSVGKTMGRHLTIFEMGAHHAFNYPEKMIYWKNKTVELCHRFLTEILGAPPESISYKESYWEGGGNAGPCLEVCIGGLEVATLVFMSYKKINGQYSPMPLRIVDTGYGMERLTWISQKTPTAFHAIYGELLDKIVEHMGISISDEHLRRYVYELSMHPDSNVTTPFKDEINRLESLFAILDHVKCLIFMLADGIVPSNVGEGYLARLVLRRIIRLTHRINLDIPLITLVKMQIKYWSSSFPKLREMESEIIDMVSVEEKRYSETLERGVKLVGRLIENLKRRGSRSIHLEKLIELYDSHGIPPELVKSIAMKVNLNLEVPKNFYSIVAERHQISRKKRGKEKILSIKVSEYPKTIPLYYENPYLFKFKAKVIGVKGKYVILDRTAFYPEGGGQPSDTGVILWPEGSAKVVNVQKIDNVIVHEVSSSPPPTKTSIIGEINVNRRLSLMRAHTATHILLAAAINVLGKHVWQAGAQKDVSRSRLDITHYKKLSEEEMKRIELLANRYVMANLPVKTCFMDRVEAEKTYGFRLYQGGVVPGRTIRIVEIKGLNVQACGGTHVKRTGEIGLIKILRASRIQDGVVRLEFACGESAIRYMQERENLLLKASKLLNAPEKMLVKSIINLKKDFMTLRERTKFMWNRYADFLIAEMMKREMKIDDLKLILYETDELPRDYILDLAARLVNSEPRRIIIIFNVEQEAIFFLILSGEMAVKKGFNAGFLAKKFASILNGKGGGRRAIAQGVGEDLKNIEKAMEIGVQYVKDLTAD